MGTRPRTALAGALAVTAGAAVFAGVSSVQRFMLSTVQGSFTATTFQVRAMFGQTTPKAFGQIWFTYAAYGSTVAPPNTPTPTYTDPPPTTTPGGGS